MLLLKASNYQVLAMLLSSSLWFLSPASWWRQCQGWCRDWRGVWRTARLSRLAVSPTWPYQGSSRGCPSSLRTSTAFSLCWTPAKCVTASSSSSPPPRRRMTGGTLSSLPSSVPSLHSSLISNYCLYSSSRCLC